MNHCGKTEPRINTKQHESPLRVCLVLFRGRISLGNDPAIGNRQLPIGNRLHRHRRAIKLRQTKAAKVLVVAGTLIFKYPDGDLLPQFH